MAYSLPQSLGILSPERSVQGHNSSIFLGIHPFVKGLGLMFSRFVHSIHKKSSVCLRWLQIVRLWLLVRFSVFPLICSCAGNTCGKLVKGCDKLVKGRGKLFKGRGRVVKGHADRSLHLGKTFRITERFFNPWPSNFDTITCNKYATILRLQIFDSLFCLVMEIFRKSICEIRKLGEVVPLKEES